MKVSVIVPTYNEEKVILDCLESLKKQSYKDVEIIVVDDGSTDGTKKLLSDYAVLSQDHKGAGAARNLGVRHSKGEILVFIDADMTFDKDFVKRLIDPILKGSAKGTFSKEEYVSNSNNVWSRCWGINEGWEVGRRHPKNYPDTQTVFRAILKSEFEKSGGFDSKKGYMDDWTLSEKLGYESVNVPGAIFYHKNPDSLNEIFSQAEWIGKRQYKGGFFGKVYALLRASLPISIVIGIWKSISSHEQNFVVFKVVYDLGVFIGILENVIIGKVSK